MDFADEYNIVLQNYDKTPQTDEVLKGNEYEICILDKAGKAIELEEILFTLQYNMPNSNTKFSSEKIYLTHNTVTKEISYTISKDVKLFVLQGSAGSSYKIKLNIEDGTTPLLIYLVDFNSQVLRGDVISAQGRTISIWSYGDSRLTGCNDTMPSNTPNKGELLEILLIGLTMIMKQVLAVRLLRLMMYIYMATHYFYREEGAPMVQE